MTAREVLAVVSVVAGTACAVTGGFMLSTAAGWLVLGVVLLVLGWLLGSA